LLAIYYELWIKSSSPGTSAYSERRSSNWRTS
jgi:hypothetical protein